MPPPLDSDLMRAFLALAENGSVTGAAAQVGRTQSALSMQLKRLEESLGQRLFARHPRGLALTTRGRQLLPYARRAIEVLDEAALALRERPLSGPVRIGLPEEYGASVLPRALATFAARHPGVDVAVRVDYASHQMAALQADEIDLAVVFDWRRDGPGEVLAIDPTVWVTSCTHEQHLRSPLPVAAYFRSSWCRDFAFAALDRQGIAYRVAYECDTAGGLQIAVSSGLAVAALARSTLPEGCRMLDERDGFGPVDSSAVALHRNPRGTSPAIEAMAETLRAAFRPLDGDAV